MTVDAPVHARFNPLIRPYLVLSIGGTLALTIVGLPFALIWLCGVGQWWARHYFERLECELDARTLRFRKGILLTVEKTIPIENIQDVTFVEGPILKRFDLAVLRFETAGQRQGQANDMRLIGIIDAQDFRNRILVARRRLRETHAEADAGRGPDATLLALQGIAQRLDTVIDLLRREPR
ncbi:PH domain-containing protein [Solimonas terrae]|uniref:PH domain-containing protein n=1 Tax=Solimonas terrae TaxID=1396819 RepID=A0A6M2BRX7_9GAMM|nr:PH domain-containing protein [Solimonas terrae]NGY05015.1 PH domain-containing protein [Solimonas terrae]